MDISHEQMKRFNSRVKGLESERSTFEPHWRELQEYVLPRLGRFMLSDTNKGGKKNGKIIDNTGKIALRVLSSGMVAGLTSPARPWFNLESPDPELQERQSVKEWLDKVKQRMNAIMSRSNLYDALPRMYSELALFGQGPIALFSDMEEVIFAQTFTAGEYFLANDYKNRVNTFGRSFRKTVGAVVSFFGRDNCSDTVKNLWDKGNYDDWVDIYHLVEPNQGRDASKMDKVNKPFRSVYWEQSVSDRALRVDGFEEFPIFAPRWEVNDGDIYASSCPAMDALGDIKQLQNHERRSAEAIDKMVRPPMVAHPALKNKHKSLLPGGVTYGQDASGQTGGFQPAYLVNPRINELEAKSQQIRDRINSAFYADLFLMLSMQSKTMTATEVAERHEEKLLMLGPILERLNNELLDPLISRVFNIMYRMQLVPPPPPELEGVDLKVEYVSVLHQAQRAVGVSSVDRWLSMIGGLAQIKPEAVHKVDAFDIAARYAEMLGIPPSMVVGNDEANAKVQEINDAQAQAQQLESAKTSASIAKDLGQVPTGEDSLINQVAGAL